MLLNVESSSADSALRRTSAISRTGHKALEYAVFLAVLACCLFCFMMLVGCAPEPIEPNEEDIIDTRGEAMIETAEELAAFFASGPESALLVSDIDMSGTMLKLTATRGNISINGGGHTIRSDASCAIRLDDGASIELESLLIESSQSAIGMLGSGTLSGSALTLNAQIHAVHAASGLIIGGRSEISLNSVTGMGIRASGVELGADSDIDISAATYALRIGRGGITLKESAKLSCTAYGDNCVYSDGELTLKDASVMRVKNSGEHNAALVGGLVAEPTATLEATSGMNGMGLFITELNDEVTLKGFSTPEVRLEAGSGSVTFSN